MLHHLARGYPYKRIGTHLGISPRTVETRVSPVLRKLPAVLASRSSHWPSLRGPIAADADADRRADPPQ